MYDSRMRESVRTVTRHSSCSHTAVPLAAGLLIFACGPAPTRPIPSAEPVVVDYDTNPGPVNITSTGPTVPFYKNADYDPNIPKPETCLGHPIGARLAPADAIIDCFRAWANASPRIQVERYATSFEGRELVRAVIASPENMARLDEIRAKLGKLADPRTLSDADAQAIIKSTPAVAWFGYSIHGDEVSGADASMAFGFHLISSKTAEVQALLERVVVIIDPVMNPDGRNRIIHQVAQNTSRVPNLDYASMHRGHWPRGRGNHYLFDMNRDWLVGSAPETRGRWRELSRWHPQLFIDAHEMGSQETYLFYPYAEPINKHLAPTLRKWHNVFAADHSHAFDRYGWAYYTREWADGWYPGYSDAWGALSGAIGILYEQASTQGQSLRRASGRVVTYRETVHAQAVSSLANLTTLARNREPVLRDYLAYKRKQVTPTDAHRTFVLRPGKNPDRERHFLNTLMRQGIEIYRTDADFTAQNAESVMRNASAKESFKQGAYLIPSAQPKGALVGAMLSFDARMDDEFLAKERAELERKGQSKLYDVTAWNLGQAFALDAFWIDGPRVAMSQVTTLEPVVSGLAGDKSEHAYAWVIDGRNDASVSFAVQALERQLTVHVADHVFSAAGRSFPRGSLVIRRGDNRADVHTRVDAAAKAAGVRAQAVTTGRSATDGPDLGGTHFHLLHRPRVAILTNWPVQSTGYGHIWYQLDRVYGVPLTLLDVQTLGYYDLRRYNVIVVPPGGPALGALLKTHGNRLSAWVRSGGTLIAAGSSAAAFARADMKLSSVRLRRDVLEALPQYKHAIAKELSARDISIDTEALWTVSGKSATEPPRVSPKAPGGKRTAQAGGAKASTPAKNTALKGKDALTAHDAWMRRFAPQGVMLRAFVDMNAWLTFGYEGELPVFVQGSQVLMSKAPVTTAVRLAAGDNLRLAGLLWPEARTRLATSAYATVESIGAGQLVLFANPPAHRAHYIGTARLLLNAVVYGPSLGASQPLAW